ncbi:helix-turn-helix domain-containing protein [Curtobacterium sp. VKM Ac-1376]|uniref:helix-turn-helix domain-containing protein n=1 Tax=Curtobacterium sp. VKM Ac-1376 TaxID=123312 RepID=UPI00188CDBC7|nr:helix-turn-helix domain-containing protein [Curtobacterium sp. VKM Ac-1376]MBF4615928.1 helix-turn-helix domain-containing protein [Curtobacterium sp. VKM Ac-1376]
MSGAAPVPAVRRAMAVVEHVAFTGVTTAGAIADDLGLAKSTVSDLVGTMLETGMLRRSGNGLVVGEAFSRLSSGLTAGVVSLEDFRRRWQRHPVLHEHTVSIQSLVGTRSLCVEVNVGVHLLPLGPGAGMRSAVWTAAGAEPVLQCFTADELARSFDVFRGYSVDDQAVRAWATEHARGVQTRPAPAASGNHELSVRLSDGSVPLVALTLHLPPNLEVDGDRLRSALTQLAASLIRS